MLMASQVPTTAAPPAASGAGGVDAGAREALVTEPALKRVHAMDKAAKARGLRQAAGALGLCSSPPPDDASGARGVEAGAREALMTEPALKRVHAMDKAEKAKGVKQTAGALGLRSSPPPD